MSLRFVDPKSLKVNVAPLVRGALIEDELDAELRLVVGDHGITVSEKGEPFRLRLLVSRPGGGIEVRGHVSGRVRLECSRCLESYLEPVEIDVDEIYHLAGQARPEDEAYRLQGDVLDLEPALNDAILLSLPMKPLCRLACPGLGAPAEVAPEEPEEAEEVDPRLEPLRRFLDRKDG